VKGIKQTIGDAREIRYPVTLSMWKRNGFETAHQFLGEMPLIMSIKKVSRDNLKNIDRIRSDNGFSSYQFCTYQLFGFVTNMVSMMKPQGSGYLHLKD